MYRVIMSYQIPPMTVEDEFYVANHAEVMELILAVRNMENVQVKDAKEMKTQSPQDILDIIKTRQAEYL